MATKKKVKRKSKVSNVVPSINKRTTMSIRKIENGMIVRITKDIGKNFMEKEFFAKNNAEVKRIINKGL